MTAAVREVVLALADAPGHRLLVDQLALADAVRQYKRGFVAAQLRRWLCWAIDDKYGALLQRSAKTRAHTS